MLDMMHFGPESREPQSFTTEDPTQKALRATLDSLSDGDLMEIERDLEYLAISGDLPERISRLIGLADEAGDTADLRRVA